jgi:hypothetical protein
MQSGARRASIILGVFMAIVLIAGVILPLFQQNSTTTQPVPDPTDIPTATFPAPVADLNTLSFDQLYLHPTGLYTIAQPTGFDQAQPNSSSSIAQVNMVNNATLSVIDAYVENPGAPVTTDQLSERLTEDALAATWTRFTNWEETSRRVDGDRLMIDFSVRLNNQDYVARQEVWTDGEWIYAVRVLTPSNAIDYLRYLLDNVKSTITPNKALATTPFDWTVTYDPVYSHLLRHPSDWQVVDGGAGRPTTLSGTNGVTVRIEGRANTSVADEAAARAWIEAERPGATVLSVQPVQRGESSGFSIAYGYSTLDGEPQSGLAVLLNGADGLLHAANLRFSGNGIDLNAVEVTAEATPAPESALLPDLGTESAGDDSQQSSLAQAMGTFQVVAPLNLSPASAPPTATPFFTPTPIIPVESTAEATAAAEATSEATTEAAVEATSEVEATAEAEVTAEAEATVEAAAEATAEATSAP